METQIIAQVAKLLRQQVKQTEKAEGAKAEAPKGDWIKTVPQDKVTLSQAAESLAKNSTSEFEEDRALKLERLKSLVQNRRYEFTDHTVNQTAERIVKMLLG